MTDSGSEDLPIRAAVWFVVVSYGLMVLHAAAALASQWLPLPKTGWFAGVCLVSSAVFVLRLNERLAGIDSRWWQSVASVVVFPGWLAVFLVEMLVLIGAVGL